MMRLEPLLMPVGIQRIHKATESFSQEPGHWVKCILKELCTECSECTNPACPPPSAFLVHCTAEEWQWIFILWLFQSHLTLWICKIRIYLGWQGGKIPPKITSDGVGWTSGENKAGGGKLQKWLPFLHQPARCHPGGRSIWTKKKIHSIGVQTD